MTMTGQSEMALPKSFGQFIFYIIFRIPFVLGTVVAVFNIVFQVQFILPCIWLALMTWGIWDAYKENGGFRILLIDFLGFFSFKQFVECMVQYMDFVDVRFGYQLFGHRLYYLTVPLDKIQEVNWSPGQNPKYWDVSVWYDHDNPKKSLKRRMLRKPDQDVYCIDPSKGRKETEVFGLAFVDFLLRAGAKLVRKDDCSFERVTVSPQTGGQSCPFAEEE
jgi:hypothetical protein